MNNEQIKNEIDLLKSRIEALESGLSVTGMSYDTKEIIRNEVIKSEDTTVTTTRTVILADFPTQLPVNPAGVIILKWRGKEFAVPYISR